MPKIVDKDRKAREIGSAALRVFGDRGFHATRIDDIAKAAGIGKGTVYEYFSNKMEILQAELDRYFDDFKAGAATAVAAASGAEGRLAALLGFSLAHVGEWADHCAAFFDAVGSARAGGVGTAWFGEIFDQARALVGGILEEGQRTGEIQPEVDREATAEAIVSLYEGYVLLAVLGVRRCSPERVRDAALRLFRQGLTAVPAADEGGARDTGKEKG